MSQEFLAIYLNDHLSGSVVALELLSHLQSKYVDAPVAGLLAELKAEILADRHELEQLMSRLNIAVSRPRKAAAWLTEKAWRALGSVFMEDARFGGFDFQRLQRRADEQRQRLETAPVGGGSRRSCFVTATPRLD